ncbi:sugar-binding protein, partial [Streptomyces sp. N2-109]
AGDSWRVVSQSNTYDTVAGRLVKVDDYGDNSTGTDNRCTRTTFATNTAMNILGLPSREETVAVKCDATPDRAEDVITDTRTAYDGAAYGAAPAKGDATATAVLEKHDGTTARYLESGTTFDGYGRQLTATDLTADVTVTGSGTPARDERDDGRTTTTAYSPTTGFAAKVTTTTPPAEKGDASTAQKSVTEFEPHRDQPVAEEDTNGKRTHLKFDALGRAWLVWLSNRRTTQHPNYQFNYHIEEGKPAAVTTRTLNTGGGDQIASYTVYDGYLRERQTQAPGPDGGRLLTDTFYDERGLKVKTFAPYYTEGAPSRTLFAPEDALSVETQTRVTYDGLGRETESRQIAGNGDGGEILGITKTIHNGDRTTVIPPEGGTATTTLNDARDQTTQLRQHHARAPEAAYDTTTYAHTPRGELAKMTDPAGNKWTYAYDQMGRKTGTTDPDKGTTTSTYDDRGNVTSTTDARGTKLVNVYDDLNRRRELREDSASGELRAKWTYDTIFGAKGHLAESTRYVDGNAYTRQITKYTRLYEVERASTTIPESEGALAGTYQEGTARYMNGLVRGRSFSTVGNILGKGWSHTYEDQTLRPLAVFTSGARADATYSLTGKPQQFALSGTGGAKKSWVTNTYDWGTQRLETSRVDRQDVPGVDRHNTYRYDQAGNVQSLSDVSRDGTDTQCFTYDYLRRLTEAWTEANKACAAAPAEATVGGPAPYWHSYTYDKAGNRLTETQHDPAGNLSQDTKRSYTYPEPGSPQPHTLASVTRTGPTGSAKDTYGYDETGNTTTRTLGGDAQKLTWGAEGRLAKVTEPVEGGEDKTTEYVYDAEGNRLISRTSDGSTFHWGDHTEVTVAKGSSTRKATRFIPLGGGHQAVLADDGTWTITVADHHGTGQLAIDAASLDLTAQRRSLPFGSPRGAEPASWPTSRGFVGGIDDTKDTGLTHLGAREYDPATGRFISVDPLMDLADPQQIHGYTYGNNNPLTYSDPTGKMFAGNDGMGYGVVLDANGKGRLSNYGPPRKKTWGGDPRTGGTEHRMTQARASGKWLPPKYYQTTCSAQHGCTETRYEPAAPKKARGLLGTAKVFGSLFFDPGAWKGCIGSFEGTSCLAAVGDIPALKWLKGLKGLKGGKPGRAGKKAAKECRRPSHSFIPGTQVLLADGTRKDIEDVQLGDKVLVTDPETGKTTTREVVGTIVTEDDKHFTDLTIATEDGPASLISTTTHPFWSPSEDKWVNAGDLAAGMTLRTPDGDTVTLTATRLFTKHQRTHDLTINNTHTYYVLAGTTPVLVHNDSGFDWEKELENLKKGWDSGDLDDDGYHAPRGNQAENKEFKDALREIERNLGREITPTERRSLHDRITGQGYGYHRIVEEGKGLFGGC